MIAETLLPKLAEWTPTAAGRQTFTDTLTGWHVRIDADRTDSVGCLVWEMTVARPDAAVDLTTWARTVADRVTGLMEPLTVHEIDATQGVALLRSEAPAERGSARVYYEVRLTSGGQALVRRFSAQRAASTPRQQVAFALTHEALAKLAGDLASC